MINVEPFARNFSSVKRTNKRKFLIVRQNIMKKDEVVVADETVVENLVLSNRNKHP